MSGTKKKNGPPEACLSCSKPLPTNGNFLVCSECQLSCHVGGCSGVSSKVFKKMPREKKAAWRCSTCVSSDSDASSENTECNMPSNAENLSNISEKLELLLPLTLKVDALLGMKVTVDAIEKSVEMLANKYDEFVAKLDKQDKAIADLEGRLGKVEEANSANETKHLRQELNQLEQYGRRLNLEIHGIPVRPNEDVLALVNEVGASLQLDEITEREIEGIHRLPVRSGKVPPIIVRFTSKSTKDRWKAKAKKLREGESPVRFFENLTPYNKRLLWLTRTKAGEMNYQFTWETNGKILVKKHSGAPIIRILSEDDLEKIQ